MKIIAYDESTLLKTGEKDIDQVFCFFEKILPMPKAVKKQILHLLTYILCM